jgi:hypothetical protein
MSSIAVMNGNTIIIPFKSLQAVWDFVVLTQLTQFAVRETPDGFSLSTPVTLDLEAVIPGVLHGARARAKPDDKPKPPTGPSGSPDGTPPGGGTPGSTSIWEQTYTEARAA